MLVNDQTCLLLEALQRSANDALLIFDAGLICRFVNSAACALTGSSKEGMMDYPASSLFQPESFYAQLRPALEQALGGASARLKVMRQHADGRWLNYSTSIEPISDTSGRIDGVVVSAHDITEALQQAERARLAVLMFEHSTEGLMIIAADQRIRLINPAFTALTGFAAEDIVGQYPQTLTPNDAAGHRYTDIWHALDYSNSWQGDVVYRCRDGRLLATWQSVIRVTDQEGAVEHYLAVITDLTERQRYEEQMEKLVYYDLLTNLPNRSLLADRMTQAMARAERSGDPVGVVFVDLDRFKAINDTLGPNQGDQVLRAVAQRLLDLVPAGATVSRYGADQFVLLLPDLDTPEDLAPLCQQYLQALAKPHQVGTEALTVTASIGIAVYPYDDNAHESLTQRAETAMQAAKKAGRNAFRFFTQDMNQRSTELLLLDNMLRRALSEQQLLLYYQPQIDIRTRQIIGMEALMRWQHPDLGLVPPNRFIPVAEESGLIVPMGQWAVEEACRQNKAWQDAGLLFAPVAVNVSARQFAEQLQAVTANALASAGLAAEWLELEVTESTLMDDVEGAILTLNSLKQMGVRLSIDDFGTGYSSLGYLKRFPLDKLKVDRSFVIDILTDSDDAAIAAAIISLAKNLRLQVIAEGVETAEQLAFLADLGCEEMQGYLVAAPLPPDEVPGFIARWQAS
ncbi:bifunctional diguanylate cyclase/phosphodiesterase [Chitinimonas sp. BJYL2]|uniref:putative bifunctional diguanylate cyclase/phosphodiesterase n=1 Tax=Chitinimonas sp. BJYL2 TaxID=2976696 RepID=UPI0022B3FE81|nr:bifunctional diguanylate cyclase/phosphodiesterase [Chitinimonas sp. BJYL2]